MDYYQILGLNSTAHASDIKRAYRRLAVMYHPDKNPSPEAESIFKQINEAYDVLSDPEKRRAYDSRFDNLFDVPVENTASRHRDPRYRPRATGTPRPSQRDSIRELMASYLKYTSAISIACFSICSVMLIDYALPTKATKEEVIKTGIRKFRTRTGYDVWSVVYTSGGHVINIPDDINRTFLPGELVTIQSSFFFSVARNLQIGSSHIPIRRSIYGNFIFAPAALLVMSGLGVLLRKNIDYGFNFGVVSFVILLIMGGILLTL